ncbi:MAG TPA: hypothetical protein VGI96_36335, partial [Streptosporangiaceae bacterium]
ATAIAGCGGGSASAGKASATETAGVAATTGHKSITADQLKSALLTKVGGSSPAAPAESGDYGALPDVQTSKQTMHAVKVKPAKCADAAVTGFNSTAFAHAPASVVTFRVGHDGISEVLVAATPQVATTALANKLPAGCQHYTATVAGKTFHYTVQERPMTGLATQARALNVKAAGYAEVNVWSVVYRADGFVGAVTVVGPDATEASAKKLATQAYQFAAQTLT